MSSRAPARTTTGFDAVIFDCDGVLVDSEVIAAEVWVEMAAELGYVLPYDTALREFKGGELAKCIAWLEGQMGRRVPAAFVQDFRARSAVRFESGELRPIPGIEAVLAGLDVPFCVASNGPREKMDVSLRVSGLIHFFEARIVSAYEVGIFKPDPGLFLAAAEVLGAEAKRCAVVEDSMTGIHAARAAQMHVFAFSQPEGESEHALDGVTWFADMRDLPSLLAGS